MTQEEKSILLKDLCARLPYGLLVKTPDHFNPQVVDGINNKLEVIVQNNLCYSLFFEAKPYLRPMTSMTDEEKAQVQMFMDIVTGENYGDGYSPSAWDAMNGFAQYCDSRHLDHRGLIFKGLALESPEGMYNAKTK